MLREIYREGICRDCFIRIFDKRYDAKIVENEDCYICEGISGESEIYKFLDIVEEKLKGYEFSTFSIGTKIFPHILEKEELLKREMDHEFTDIKSWLNRKIGRGIEERTGKKFVLSNPDIVVIVDTRFDYVYLQVSSVYIYGRYLKMVRGIPQTKWPCRVCRGIGCRRCNYTGKQYDESVEELISKKALEDFKGTDESFHGAGREDIDARMLGNGRPFVLEIKNPRIRNVNLKDLEKKINDYAQGKIRVVGLRISNRDEVRRLKEEKFLKSYQAKIVCDITLQEKKLKEALSSLEGIKIKQQTPKRVSHRRSDRIREKKIYGCKLIWVKGNRSLIEIRAESGTYIKELISGDNGRTKPSLSEILGAPCKVEELDVISVEGE